MEPYTKEEKEKIEERLKTSSEHWYGAYLIIFFMLSAGYTTAVQNIPNHSFSFFPALLVGVLGGGLELGIVYFLILWIVDLTRRRGGIDRPENKKVRLVINIIFAVALTLVIASSFMVLLRS